VHRAPPGARGSRRLPRRNSRESAVRLHGESLPPRVSRPWPPPPPISPPPQPSLAMEAQAFISRMVEGSEELVGSVGQVSLLNFRWVLQKASKCCLQPRIGQNNPRQFN
jgi:hypothetical protein